jgi:hypothetical protein
VRPFSNPTNPDIKIAPFASTFKIALFLKAQCMVARLVDGSFQRSHYSAPSSVTPPISPATHPFFFQQSILFFNNPT